jgi:hypothetical protein
LAAHAGAFRLEEGGGRLVSLTGEARTGLTLPFHRGQGGGSPAALGGFLDGLVNLA